MKAPWLIRAAVHVAMLPVWPVLGLALLLVATYQLTQPRRRG